MTDNISRKAAIERLEELEKCGYAKHHSDYRNAIQEALGVVKSLPAVGGWLTVACFEGKCEEEVWLWCADENYREGKPIGPVLGRFVDYGDGDYRPRGSGMNGDWRFTHWTPLNLPKPPEGIDQ
jgi:hypothetical protein